MYNNILVSKSQGNLCLYHTQVPVNKNPKKIYMFQYIYQKVQTIAHS